MMLGNQSLDQMEKRLGITIPIELSSYLATHRQENISIPLVKGYWHCFDLPFTLLCGGMELRDMVVNSLSPLSKDVQESMSICYQD
jgi:hypothetical protein